MSENDGHCKNCDNLVDQLAAERRDNNHFLMRHGFVPCDIAACNCGSWHHRYGLPERFNEIKDALTDAGFPPCNDNGNLVSAALKELIDAHQAERKRAAEAERMLSIGNKCDECGCSFKGPPCLFVKSGWCKHNEERAMDKTTEQIMASAVNAALNEGLTQHEAWMRCAAAVIAHVTPQIRAAAVEEAANQCRLLAGARPDPGNPYDARDCSDFSVWESLTEAQHKIRALANLPPSHVCAPAEFIKRAAEAERMLSIGNKCDECGCSFKGPPCLFVKSGWCKHNEERAMDKTTEQIMASAVNAALNEGLTQHEAWMRCAAAVIAHVTPQIRAAAIEDAILRMTAFYPNAMQCIRTGASHIAWERIANTLANEISALAALPPSHVCVPVDLLDALCSEEGAEQKDLNIARSLLAAAKGKK